MVHYLYNFSKIFHKYFKVNCSSHQKKVQLTASATLTRGGPEMADVLIWKPLTPAKDLVNETAERAANIFDILIS